EGTTVSGAAADSLTAILHAAGLRWSVQDGVVWIAPRGARAPQPDSVLVRDGSGLAGPPSISTEGLLEIRMFLIPDVYPGRHIRVESERIKGPWQVERAVYVGDSRSDEWTITCECKELFPAE